MIHRGSIEVQEKVRCKSCVLWIYPDWSITDSSLRQVIIKFARERLWYLSRISSVCGESAVRSRSAHTLYYGDIQVEHSVYEYKRQQDSRPSQFTKASTMWHAHIWVRRADYIRSCSIYIYCKLDSLGIKWERIEGDTAGAATISGQEMGIDFLYSE